MAHDVLISYSSRDKLQADAICNRLESRGIRCWIAPRDVGLGEYAASIVEAIEESQVMVLVFSANADESHQVRREVERAVSKGKKIVPVRIEDAEMSKSLELYVSSVHWLDAITPPFEQHIDRLADELGALLGQEVKAAPASPAATAATPATPAPKPTTPPVAATPPPAAPTPPPAPAAQAPSASGAAPARPPATPAPAAPASAGASSALGGKLPMVLGAVAIVVVVGIIWIFSMSGGDDLAAPPQPGTATGEPVEQGEPMGATEEVGSTMTFFNNAAVPVRLYGVDADGYEEDYGLVGPQERHTEPTDDGQFWVVRTAEDNFEMEIVTCQAEGPESDCVIELVTGWTVVAAEFGGADGMSVGAYRAVDDDTWVEEGPDGEVRFEFIEEDRDDWSVTLYDEQRGVTIVIDLGTDKILYGDSSGVLVELYEILYAFE